MGVFVRWIGLGGGILTLAAIALLSSLGLRRVRTDTAWVDHTHQVLASIARVRLLVTEASSSRRSLVTAGNPFDRDRYASAQSQIDRELASLERFVRDNPEEIANTARLVARISAWRSVLDASLAAYDRNGFVFGDQNELTERARPLAAAIHELARRMEDEEERLLALRQAEARASAQRTRRIVIAGNVLGLLLLIGAATISTLEARARRRAEAVLRSQAVLLEDSQKQYRTLFDSIDEGFCIIQMLFDERDKPFDYRFLEINPAFAKQTGLLDAQGKTMRELAPLHEEHWFETYGRIALTGEPLRFQNRAEQLNRWYDVYAFRFGDPDARQVAILFRDITERKRAEDNLREAQDLVRLLGENVRDYSIFLLDKQGRIETWTRGAEMMKGYTASEIIGKHFSIFYTPEDVQTGKPEQRLRQAEMNGRSEDRGWRIRKDGSRFWADVVINSIKGKDGQIRGFAKITRNIDDTHRAEELQHSEAFLDSIIENVPAMLFVKDADSLRFVRFNRAGEELLGISRDELLGKNDFDFFPQAEAEAFVQRDRKVLEGGILADIPEEAIHSRSRGERILHTKKIPILDEKLRPRYLLGISEDITERRDFELTLQRQANELAAANQELESFSYSVSHDLRAPLRAIDGFSQALLEESGDRLGENGKRYLGKVRAAAQRMAQIIDDLLSLSRVSRQPLERTTVDLTKIAREAFALISRQHPDRNAVLEAPHSVKADADEGLLRIVLQNLVGNAWKFTARREDAKIEFGARNDGSEPHYFVRDNGAGFDMAYAGKLFGAFQRLHTEGEFSGTGIGLATVARIVHRHGGRVWAEGRVGEGATFWFTL